MKIIHLTDIHLTIPPMTIYDRDPNESFEKALAHIATHHSDAEALFISGDLTELGEIETYQRLRARLNKFKTPAYLTLGNHDNRENFAAIFPDHLDANGFAQRVVPLSSGTGILLDTHDVDSHKGRLCPKRLDWFDAALETAPSPFFVFLHHHPLATGLERMDRTMLQDSEAFATRLERHRNRIAHVFFGHCHLLFSGSINGVPVSAGRSTNQNSWPDFAGKRALRGADVPRAYRVVTSESRNVAIHTVELGGPW
ncbi:MAG: phosphodiesterase [Pseudomonadota bacterium]